MSTTQGGAQLANLLNAATAASPGPVAADPPAPPAHSHAPPPPTATPPPGAALGPHSKSVKAEDHYPSPPQGPPTPAATTSSPGSFTVPLPSFVHDDPLSSDPDSSSDEDSFGEPKPPRPKRFSKSTGLARPVPSYYYDAEYDPGTAGTKKRGRRGGYKGVPVFEPTMADFADNGGFYGYVKRIEKYGLRSGIVKVVPPKEWTDSLKPVDKPLRSIRLRDAIEQHMLGSQGLYRVMNEAKTRQWNSAQWKDLATRPKWEAPDLVGDEKKGERSERSVISDRARKRRASAAVDTKKGKGKAREDDESDEAAEEDGEEGDAAAGSPKRRTPARRAKVDGAAKMAAAKVNGRGRGAAAGAADDEPSDDVGPDRSASDPPVQSKRRRASMAPANPTDDQWAAFVAGLDELPHGMSRDEYTVERLRDFERRYWRTLTFGEPPMYGADMAGSLFDDSTTAWNVAHLGDLLPKLAPRGCDIPGVVSPYLYFGMWRATFAWHVEDADLYSINYIHFGAPKFWYSVPQEQSERFERVMAGLFPTDRSKCNQFLRHKSFLASPKILTNNGITLNRCVQLPGEFILTYPKGYHSGFNLGFNCAESINFATERWLPLGKVTKHCQCIEDSVNIDVATWLRQAAKDEHLDRGEPWPYDELEEKALLAQIEAEDRAEAERVERENAVVESAASLARKRAPTGTSDRPVKKAKQASAAYQIPMVLMPAVPGVPPSGPLYTLSILQALQSNDVLAEVKAQLQHLIQHPSGTWRLDTPVQFQVVPHPNPPPPPAPVSRTKAEPNPYAASAFHYPKQGTPRPPPGSSTSHASSSATPAPASAASAGPVPVVAPGSAPLGRQPSVNGAAAGPVQQPQPVAPPKPEFPCALCPDASTEGLVMIGEPGVKSSKKRQDAHRVCVMFTPATWIEIDPESGEEITRGFGKIEKARWKLKCQLCAEVHGTKVQCTKGKCIKAFHVTCALRENSGVHLDATIADLDGSGAPISILELTRAATPPPPAPAAVENVEPQQPVEAATAVDGPPPAVEPEPTASPSKPIPNGDQIQLTVLCRTHNPTWQRLEIERKATELREKVDKLQRGDRIRVKTNGGMYDVVFDSKDDDKETVEYVFEDGKRASVKWKLIVWPDSPEKQRKKEEAAARAEREKMAILDRPAYRAPAKRTTSAQAVTPAPAVAPVQQPPAPHPAMQPFYTGAAAAPPPTATPLSHAQAAHLQAYGYPSAAPPPAPPAAYGYPPQYHHPSHVAPPPHAYYPPPQHPAPSLPTYPLAPQQGYAGSAGPPCASYAPVQGQAGPPPQPYAGGPAA
ncbi:hypothetical protein JCM8208_006875 [Rhodotorula glutinis]